MTVPPTARPVDLQRHLEPAPYTVQEQLSLRRTYRLFVNMGLRHLVVLDPLGSIAGIITRCAPNTQVRKKPGWSRSWSNFSLL